MGLQMPDVYVQYLMCCLRTEYVTAVEEEASAVWPASEYVAGFGGSTARALLLSPFAT